MGTDFTTELTMLGEGGGGGGGGRTPERTFDIKRFLRLRLLPMAIIFTVVAVPGAIAVFFLVPEQYSATAQILYAVDTPSHIDNSAQLNERQLQRFFNDQVNFISHSTILGRVKADPVVSQIPWIKAAGNDLEPLRSTVSARILPGSNMMNITVTTDNSENALSIVTSVVKEYRAEATSRNRESSNTALETLRREKEEKQQELDELDRELMQFYNTLNAPLASNGQSYGSDTQAYLESLSEAKKDESQALSQIQQAQAEIKKLEEYRAQVNANPDEPLLVRGIESRVAADLSVQSINQQVIQREAEIATLRATLKSEHPRLRSAIKALEANKRELKAVERTARKNLLEEEIDSMKLVEVEHTAALEEARSRIQKFEDSIADNKQSDIEQTKRMAELDKKKDEIASLQEDIARNKRDIDEIMRESQAVARIQNVGAPESSDSADHKERIKFILAVLAAAGGLAGGYGILRELTDQAVRTPQDIRSVTMLPLLASVPHSTHDRIPGGGTVPLLTAEHPISTIADEFRRILTRIIYPPEGAAELNTVLVASPARGDGKTAMACNLAISLAQANRRVLLLDVSARHPSIETCYGLEPAEGLSEVLCGEAHPADLVRTTAYPNLSVLGPGFRQKQLVGKLASREMVEFLEQAEEAYEHVVIDSPPALLMSDAKLLAPVVDGVIVICGVGKSTLGMMRRCLTELNGIGANVVGIVLNGIRPQRGGYLAKNLQQYYQYSEGRVVPVPTDEFSDIGSAMPKSWSGGSNGDSDHEGEVPMMILVDDGAEEDALSDEDDLEVRS